jgi:DNA-binding Xre family transcriptional regulator
MARRMGYRWHLRQVMAQREMFATTELAPLLAERGIQLSAAQVYRLVTQTPERLNLRVLAALCDILDVTPSDLIEPVVETSRTRATGSAGKTTTAASGGRRPRRAEISGA